MIRKITSGGQPGVELAALEVAFKLGIAHGGWVPKQRRHQEDAPDHSKYMLQESNQTGFQNAKERNVIEADGVLLITKGQKTPQTRFAVQMALKHQKQLLHVDLSQNSAFEGASLVNSWFSLHAVKVVYVTGPDAQQAPDIYNQTLKILETAFYLSFVKSGFQYEPDHAEISMSSQKGGQFPQNVSEAVNLLKSALPLKDRAVMANMQFSELDQLHSGLGEYIKQNFGLYSGNVALTQSCAETGGLVRPIIDEVCAVILRALWEDLQTTHKLRVIK